MHDINKLVKLCQGHPVYIQTHNFPDPDAIASAYGLQKLLRIYGVEAELGHASMGGGFINKKSLPEAEHLQTDYIRNLLLETLAKESRPARKVVIPMEIADKIREREYIYRGYPGEITKYLSVTQKSLICRIFPSINCAITSHQNERLECPGSGHHADWRVGNRPCDEVRVQALYDG